MKTLSEQDCSVMSWEANATSKEFHSSADSVNAFGDSFNHAIDLDSEASDVEKVIALLAELEPRIFE